MITILDKYYFEMQQLASAERFLMGGAYIISHVLSGSENTFASMLNNTANI